MNEEIWIPKLTEKQKQEENLIVIERGNEFHFSKGVLVIIL